MRNFLHLCYIPFTGLGLKGGYRGDDWFRYRIELFKNYTLKSLLNQTCRDFVIWISFRPEEKENPITKDFAAYMDKTGQPYIFTFHGLCFYDDKFKDEENLLRRLKATLPELKLEKTQYIFETLQPSDDVYHLNAIKTIQEQQSRQGAMVHQKGLIWNKQTQRLADWQPLTCPPFYTIIYPSEVFFDPQKHYDFVKGFKSHEDIPKLFDCVRLPDHGYCVLVHSKNISTNWYNPFRGKVYSWEKGKEILKQFGIETTSEKSEALELKAFLWYNIRKVLIAIKIYKIAKIIKNKIEVCLIKKSNTIKRQ